MKHTPGPWKIGHPPPNGEQTIGTERGLMVAVATTGLDETLANATLIAEAPNLLKELKELLLDITIAQANMRTAAKYDHRWEGCAEVLEKRIESARNVISKATGDVK